MGHAHWREAVAALFEQEKPGAGKKLAVFLDEAEVKYRMGTHGGTELVVLVNEHDEAIGSMEKMEAHRLGRLHRAFGIFLFDAEGRVLLQQCAAGKYHSPGLWSNACYDHPRPGEDLLPAAERRLKEELGTASKPGERFAFSYHARFANDLQEHEFDHVLFSLFDGKHHPDPAEVKAVRWLSPEELSAEVSATPETFTPWLLVCWERVRRELKTFVRPVQARKAGSLPG